MTVGDYNEYGSTKICTVYNTDIGDVRDPHLRSPAGFVFEYVAARSSL
jgi:hypothetical protein